MVKWCPVVRQSFSGFRVTIGRVRLQVSVERCVPAWISISGVADTLRLCWLFCSWMPYGEMILGNSSHTKPFAWTQPIEKQTVLVSSSHGTPNPLEICQISRSLNSVMPGNHSASCVPNFGNTFFNSSLGYLQTSTNLLHKPLRWTSWQRVCKWLMKFVWNSGPFVWPWNGRELVYI